MTAAGRAGRPARGHGAWRWLAAATVLFFTACATVMPAPRNAEDAVISGRLSLRVEAIGSEPARSFSAAFDLRGDARSGTLGLSTPLGNLLAEARWSAAEVTLTTPQGTRAFADLDGLTREVLGESVPVEAWFDWLRGRPWPAAPSVPRAGDGFEQLGWSVDVARLPEGRVSALREQPRPQVTVRIQLDES